jgi:hypothetical protein
LQVFFANFFGTKNTSFPRIFLSSVKKRAIILGIFTNRKKNKIFFSGNNFYPPPPPLYLKSDSEEKLSVKKAGKAFIKLFQKANAVLTHLRASVFFYSGTVLQNRFNMNIFLGVEYE